MSKESSFIPSRILFTCISLYVTTYTDFFPAGYLAVFPASGRAILVRVAAAVSAGILIAGAVLGAWALPSGTVRDVAIVALFGVALVAIAIAVLGWIALKRSSKLQVRRLQISGPYIVIQMSASTLMWKRGQVDFHVSARRVIAIDREGSYELRFTNYSKNDFKSVTRNLDMFNASGADSPVFL